MNSPPRSNSPLPADYAFVIQLAAHTSLDLSEVSGRIEHVRSRVDTTFNSLDDLINFIKQMLVQVHHNSKAS